MFSMERFSDWLLNELAVRNMTQSDLAHAAKLGSGTISNIMSGNRKVGQETLIKIADALRLPAELVFEKAGLLPPKPELSPIKRQLLHIAQELPDEDVEVAIAMLETMLKKRAEHYRHNPQARPVK